MKLKNTSAMIRVAFCALVILFGFTATGAAEDIEAVIAGVESRYQGGAFSADFKQASTLKALEITDTAEGRLFVEKPGKMRWTYERPEPQVVITDGVQLWVFRPQENQLMLGKAPSFFADGKGAGFLSDIGVIRRQFDIEQVPTQGADRCRLRLTPHRPSVDITEIDLMIRKDTFDIVGVETVNAYGDVTRIDLFNQQFHEDLSDALFEFTAPEGVDIVQMGE